MLVVLLCTVACMSNTRTAEAFATTRTTSFAFRRSTLLEQPHHDQQHHEQQQPRSTNFPLHATLTPPPAEEEKEKDKNKKSSNKDDWTPTKEGGFIPNIFKRSSSKQRTSSSPILEVTDIQDYKDQVVDVEDQMVVVRFYAPWCRSCKAVEPLFKRMAIQNSPHIKFVDCPVTKENAYLHEGLGIPSVPFGHIYHPDVGLVEERKLNKKDFKEFKQVLGTYVAGECQLPSDDDNDDDNDIVMEQPFM
jgi:thiol-disulfide isomerase/thioredoxin